MCFAPASRKVNLLEAEPPSKDLLLTCKQIFAEARLMRKKAYRDFWTTSTFEIVKPMNARLVQERDTSKNIENINEDDFRHIKRMNVMTPHNARVWILHEDIWTLWVLRVERNAMVAWYRDLSWPRNSWTQDALRKAGFSHLDMYTSASLDALDISELSAGDIKRAKQIIQKNGLSKEELLLLC